MCCIYNVFLFVFVATVLYVLAAIEMFVCCSWKKHMQGNHDKAIEALKHYFTQVCSGVSTQRFYYKRGFGIRTRKAGPKQLL